MKTHKTNDWTARINAWSEFAHTVRERANRIRQARYNEGRRLAESVGIPVECVHNAALDTKMTGWCANSPERLRVAKRVKYILGRWQWEPTDIADRIIKRAWDRFGLNK